MSDPVDELKRKFPNLYRDPYLGVSFGPGWYELVYELSEKLEALILKLPKLERENCYVVQVKEKWGGLRFYLSSSTTNIHRLISKTESQSRKICEDCGQPGEPRDGGWIRTQCLDCFKQTLMRKYASRLVILLREGISVTKEEWDKFNESKISS